MLADLLGVRLVLWMGGAIPTPAPSSLLDSLVSAQVRNDSRTGDGFTLTFNIVKDGPDYSALSGGALDPDVRVWIGVAMGVTPEPLIDGIIENVSVQPSTQPGRSTVTVTGQDVSCMMKRTTKIQKHENQPDSVIFASIIGGYGKYGLVPMPETTTDVPIMTDRTPWQRATDFDFIAQMAQRNGFVFYVEPLTFGSNKAYFGSSPRAGSIQPALTINMGGDSNVTQLSFNNDPLAAVSAESRIVQREARTSIRIPAVPTPRLPPLAARPTMPSRTVTLRDMANRQPGQAVTAALAYAMRQEDTNNCHGTIDGVRYGTVLRARRIVGLRGAGQTHNGLWAVKRVEHQIARGSYTQSFQLSREGTGALLPVVPP
jgi:phage protein D